MLFYIYKLTLTHLTAPFYLLHCLFVLLSLADYPVFSQHIQNFKQLSFAPVNFP